MPDAKTVESASGPRFPTSTCKRPPALATSRAGTPVRVNALALKAIRSHALRRTIPRTTATDQTATSVAPRPPSKPAATMGAKLTENEDRSYSSNARSSDNATSPRIPATSARSGSLLVTSTQALSARPMPIVKTCTERNHWRGGSHAVSLTTGTYPPGGDDAAPVGPDPGGTRTSLSARGPDSAARIARLCTCETSSDADSPGHAGRVANAALAVTCTGSRV